MSILKGQRTTAEAHLRRAVAQHARGAANTARHAYLEALRSVPDFPEALAGLGALLMDEGELLLAEQVLRRALAIEPAFSSARRDLGSVLGRQRRNSEAIAVLQAVLERNPEDAAALCSLGFVLDGMGDEAGASTCYELALRTQPGLAVARFSRSMLLLAQGRFQEGWREYEARWEIRQFCPRARTFAAPHWRGEELQGKRLYLYAEQGLGDTIQFARYACLLAAAGAEIVLLVQEPLAGLLYGLHPKVEIRTVQPAAEEHFDWHCPLMSVPGILGTELATIPWSGPYLRAQRTTVEHWRRRVQGDVMKVGLVWSGNPGHHRDTLRSIGFDVFAGMLDVQGIRFYSLQKGPAASQMHTDRGIVDLASDLQSFEDTAGAIANLNLVITVDTAVAHLAGAMGKPVWILLPQASDWRWLKARTYTPWYPSARLFRQTVPGDWSHVAAQVRRELAVLAQTAMVA